MKFAIQMIMVLSLTWSSFIGATCRLKVVVYFKHQLAKPQDILGSELTCNDSKMHGLEATLLHGTESRLHKTIDLAYIHMWMIS